MSLTKDEIKKVQKFLGVEVDGLNGPKTTAAVKEWQKSHGLEDDGIVGAKTWAAMFNEGLNKPASKGFAGALYSPLSNHITRVNGKVNKYIVIHYTCSTTSVAGSALKVKNVFAKRQASSDFVVDDGGAVQLNPDLLKYGTWHCGDKKNPYSKGGQYYGKCTNRNSIGIEVCSNLKKGFSTHSANNEGWYYSAATLDNLVKLVRELMKVYNIPKERVIRHYDVSGKVCPGIIGWNNEPIYSQDDKKTKEFSNSTEWLKFKSRL